MARRNQDYQSIRSEGGLLPADLLARVLNSDSGLEGLKPSDYGLAKSERLNEVITQSWSRLQKHWEDFREAATSLPENEAGTGLTNDKWSLPLLRELGFGLLPTTAGPAIDGRTYAISRFLGPVPIHLVGCGLSLDRRTRGQRGAASINPHGLVQEYLNRSDDHLWAIVSNGLQFRILRDNQALSRQSFLEFDLEAMFEGEIFSDFVLLWLVGHATRFMPPEGQRPEASCLEHWTQEAEKQGTRALGDLRVGVENSLQILGEGFTSHPRNTELRDHLRSGELALADFHSQLLRVVYQFIFLFVAEDRTLEGQSLLHPRENTDEAKLARERYATYYSGARLREMASQIKGSRHSDLWQQFQLLVNALSGDKAYSKIREQLALPALGSFLWSSNSTKALSDAVLSNYDLLESLRHLAFTRQGKVLRPVDYRNLGSEELGGVYESLLALTPQVSADGKRFHFAEFSGSERKTSGSYYTPDSLVQRLLDSALDPVVEQAVEGKSGKEAERAILGLKVCDPAVGSGHFLVGAAHRLARHLARVRALVEGESEPSPLLYQHALRDVIGQCLYGVDVNPMAAELCRVSLWLEALEPGKPLSFLDHHIRVGNSLLGTTPELIDGGLPDDAFKHIEGDDKKICTALKRRNKQEREGKQMDLGLPMVAESRADYNTLASRSLEIDQAPDDSLEAIELKAKRFNRLVVLPEYRHHQKLADAWCAAIIWSKKVGSPEAITTDTIRRMEVDANALNAAQHKELARLANQYQFFHWHLVFPEVFAEDGFDCVLGNPPWEKINLRDEEFFAISHPHIAQARTKAERKRFIDELSLSDPISHQKYTEEQDSHNRISHCFRYSGAFPLTGVSRINLFSVFTELGCYITSRGGRLGMVLPSGIVTDDNNKALFEKLTSMSRLVSVYDFENRKGLFPEVDSRYKFSLVTVQGSESSQGSCEFAFFLQDPSQIEDEHKKFSLSAADISLINPETKTCPVFRSGKEAEVAKGIYRRVKSWGRHDQSDNWPGFPKTPFNTANDSVHFVDTAFVEHSLPSSSNGDQIEVEGALASSLYESKMTHAFDHRYSSFVDRNVLKVTKNPRETSLTDHNEPSLVVSGRHWVPGVIRAERFPGNWFCSYRDITNATNERTSIAAMLPGRPAGNTLSLLMGLDNLTSCWMLSVMNSFVFDFVARTKVAGLHFSHFIWKQMPFKHPNSIEHHGETPGQLKKNMIEMGALELSYTAWDLHPFACGFGWDGPPFRWDEERRFLIRCELDAALFNLYLPTDERGSWRPARKSDDCPFDETVQQIEELKHHFPTPRDAVDYIMDTFPIVQRKDEGRFGEYRTKRIILEIYDEMQEAIRTGQLYESRLDPPPGPPTRPDGSIVSYDEILDNPPPHLHLPCEGSRVPSSGLQLSDLSSHFPSKPFKVRLGISSDTDEVMVTPAKPAEIEPGEMVALACPGLVLKGKTIPAAIGKLQVQSMIDASTGQPFVSVIVKTVNGMAKVSLSKAKWDCLTSIGVVNGIN